MTDQSQANNITTEVRGGRIFYIFGSMRNGKTLLGACMGYNDYYPRIYSNFQIYNNGKSVLTQHITTYEQLERIRFSYKEGVIIIDEGGINANSKDGFSDTSRLMEKLVFLSGKKNCDIIFIAQRYKSGNVNFRELASKSGLIIECVKVSRTANIPIFYCTRYKVRGNDNLEFYSQWETHPIEFMQASEITYNTLETSGMTSEKKDAKALGKNEIVK